MQDIEKYKKERAELNDLLMENADQSMKRFLSLDSQVYRHGALPKRSKEMLGLVASLVLRCDDCIKHHLIQCHECGVKDEELMEVLSIGVVVGGSVTIPHVRIAIKAWDELKSG